MAEDYGVSLKITADTSDLDKIPQKVEETRKEIEQPVEQTVKVNEQREPAAPVEHPAETVPVVEQREPAAPVEHPAETVPVQEQREPAAPVEHPAETVAVQEQREPAAPVEHPAETVPVTERRETAAPVEHPAETVEVREKRVVESRGGDIPVAAERTETIKVDPPKPVVVPVKQDPDPLKIAVEPPKPVVVPVKQNPDPLKPKVEQPEPAEVPVKQTPDPLKPKVEKPAPVKIEAKAEKVRVEVEDEEAKRRIEALTEKEGVKRIRVVTEGGELATRQGGKEIFELEVDAERAKQTIADLKADARLKVTADTSQAISGFNAMRAASAALHGNFMALGMEIAKIGNGIGAMKSIGVGGFFAIGAAITGVVSLAKSLQGLFQTLFNVGTVGKDITSIGASLVDITNRAEQFADAMNDARKASELVNQSLEKEIAALGRVAKAQNELNRQRELSGAKSDKERDAINTKYDSQAIDIGADTARQTEELKRKGIVDEIARLEQEIAQSKKTQSDYEAKAAEARSRANIERPTNALTASAEDAVSFFTGKATSEEKSNAASAVATKAQNAADDEAERRAQLEEELEKRRHDLKNADLEAEARKAEEAAAKAKNAQDAATKNSQEEERKAKENAEKDKRQQNAQTAYTEQRDRRTADADFDARFRAAQRRASAPDATEAQRNEAENAQLELLRGREAEASAELEAAEKELAEEMAKEAKDRDEDRMSRARERAARAQGEQISAAQQREDLTAQIENRRVTEQQDYFGNLAQQIEQSRPKNRLTAMGLGSGGPSDSTGREQVSIQREIAKSLREAISAIRANKPGDGTAVYAP